MGTHDLARLLIDPSNCTQSKPRCTTGKQPSPQRPDSTSFHSKNQDICTCLPADHTRTFVISSASGVSTGVSHRGHRPRHSTLSRRCIWGPCWIPVFIPKCISRSQQKACLTSFFRGAIVSFPDFLRPTTVILSPPGQGIFGGHADRSGWEG